MALIDDPWSFACKDWFDRLQHGRSIVPQLPLNQALAKRAVEIFDNLRLPDVKDQPEMREACGEWYRDIIRAALGSIDPETGRRRVGEIFLLVPKKNTKTTNDAALMLTAMMMNERPHAEMILIGPTQIIANTAFNQAWHMITADPALARRFKVTPHLKLIEDQRSLGSTLKVKTFDMKVVTGGKAVVVLLDEIHILSTFSYASNVMTQIRGGFMANPESLLIMITSQSDQPPAGLFKQELDYARAVRNGRITDNVRTLPVIYEFPEKMQTDKAKPWKDPRNWHLVHPNLGRSVHLPRLIEQFTTAENKGQDSLGIWASQFLGIEVGLALHAARWRGADYWEAAREPKLTLAKLLERSEVVTVGVDGGGLDDLLGLAVLGRCAETSKWLVWVKAWVQSTLLELRPDIAERLTDFAADGDLVLLPKSCWESPSMTGCPA